MVLFLVLDVTNNCRLARGAYRESAVSDLPGEAALCGPFLMQPAAGVGLYDTQAFRDAQFRRQTQKQVDVILDATNGNRHAPEFADNAAEISVKVGANFGADVRNAIFGRENNVVEQIG